MLGVLVVWCFAQRYRYKSVMLTVVKRLCSCCESPVTLAMNHLRVQVLSYYEAPMKEKCTAHSQLTQIKFIQKLQPIHKAITAILYQFHISC